MSLRNAPYDVVILGGGLAGGLIARAIALAQPDRSVAIVEAGARLGGNHVWSFFDGDIAAADRALVEPLIAYRWDAYDVRFPRRRRRIGHRYNSITSARFDEGVRAALPDESIVTGTVATVAGDTVTLTDGRTVTGLAVIDARGPGDLSYLQGGWQKFVGQRLTLAVPHGLDAPIVMDACVDQTEGFRFVYVLPLDPVTVFVEDTYYSDTPALDVPALRARIADYAATQGWQVTAVAGEETGVLPVTTGGDFARYLASTGTGAKAGMRAGLYHPLTGYSLPDAVRMARAIADSRDWSAGAIERLTRTAATERWAGRGFYRLLAKMLFAAADPPERYRVLEHFYRLPPALIERFYGGQTTLWDRVRILSGRPPVPLGRAMRTIVGKQA